MGGQAVESGDMGAVPGQRLFIHQLNKTQDESQASGSHLCFWMRFTDINLVLIDKRKY
jgi:hypothetical protein